MRPDRQAEAMKLLHSARLLAADAMLSYIKLQPPEAKDVLGRAGWYFCNEDEFAALGGGVPDEFRRRWWLEGLVLKAGPKGVTAHTADGSVHVPALPDYPAFDTTGAGDAVAGGMLARWLSTGAQRGGLQDALVCGVACASLTIESIGVRGISSVTPKLLDERIAVPAVGTGIAGVAIDECGRVMAECLNDALSQGWQASEVRFVLFGEESKRPFETAFWNVFRAPGAPAA